MSGLYRADAPGVLMFRLHLADTGPCEWGPIGGFSLVFFQQMNTSIATTCSVQPSKAGTISSPTLMLLCLRHYHLPPEPRLQVLLCVGSLSKGCYCHDDMPKQLLWKVDLYRAQTTPSGCPSSGSGIWRSRALSTSFTPDPWAKSKLIMIVVVVTTLRSKGGSNSYAH